MYKRRNHKKSALAYDKKRKEKRLLLEGEWLLAMGMLFFSVLVTAAAFILPERNHLLEIGRAHV